MADFCNQCAEDSLILSPEETAAGMGDFFGISKPEDTAAKQYPLVLCEGCGACQVDHLGACVSPNCAKQHGLTGV